VVAPLDAPHDRKVTAPVELIDEFEAVRPRLLSLAHRILGSHEDAEDAVQTAWLRALGTDPARIDNPAAWLTTVTSRLCLDRLRARERRGELPLLADALPAEQLDADEEFLRREDVSRALLVLLHRLTAAQRVAYVLHDLFRMPFAEVALVLDTSTANAKTLASRARRRLDGADAEGAELLPQTQAQRRIVEAFLAAARGGCLDTLVTLMAPDVARTADRALLPAGGETDAIGSRAVAEETRRFADRIRATVPMLLDGGEVAAIIAPGGHPLAVITFAFAQDRISRLGITVARREDLLGVRRFREPAGPRHIPGTPA